MPQVPSIFTEIIQRPETSVCLHFRKNPHYCTDICSMYNKHGMVFLMSSMYDDNNIDPASGETNKSVTN